MPQEAGSSLVDDVPDEEFNNKELVENESAGVPKPTMKLCTQMERKWTHNEQLIVAPCGIILACKTFYGAEGLATIIVSVCYTLPYMVQNDPYFKDVGLFIDIFHFKCKHFKENE
jgi:hypothetical protein